MQDCANVVIFFDEVERGLVERAHPLAGGRVRLAGGLAGGLVEFHELARRVDVKLGDLVVRLLLRFELLKLADERLRQHVAASVHQRLLHELVKRGLGFFRYSMVKSSLVQRWRMLLESTGLVRSNCMHLRHSGHAFCSMRAR